MSKLDTLFKRAKTGKPVYYKIWTEGATIYKETGQWGTEKPIVHTDTVTPKNVGRSNETTPEEQAVLEMKSAWRKKKDEGYKDWKDLGISISGDLMHFRFDGVDYETQTEVLDKALPTFNTDASGNIKPMLAQPWEKVKKKGIPYPCLLQPKLDGVRCLMVLENGEITFYSRSGKEYTTLNHIRESLQSYVSALTPPYKFVFDGEVYTHGKPLQEITAAVKKQRPESLDLKFRMYDIVDDQNQRERWQTTYNFGLAFMSKMVTTVETHLVTDDDMVQKFHDQFVKDGYEGCMLRLMDGTYGQGQRSRSLLKVKIFDHTEFEFLRFEKGKRDQDLMVVVKVDRPNFGVYELPVKASGTTQYKKELESHEAELVGTPYTVKHFGYTKEEVPFIATGETFRDYE